MQVGTYLLINLQLPLIRRYFNNVIAYNVYNDTKHLTHIIIRSAYSVKFSFKQDSNFPYLLGFCATNGKKRIHFRGYVCHKCFVGRLFVTSVLSDNEETKMFQKVAWVALIGFLIGCYLLQLLVDFTNSLTSLGMSVFINTFIFMQVCLLTLRFATNQEGFMQILQVLPNNSIQYQLNNRALPTYRTRKRSYHTSRYIWS